MLEEAEYRAGDVQGLHWQHLVLFMQLVTCVSNFLWKRGSPKDPKVMLGQDCLRAGVSEQAFPLKVGSRCLFVNLLRWVRKWVRSGFLGARVGEKASKPTVTHFGPIS